LGWLESSDCCQRPCQPTGSLAREGEDLVSRELDVASSAHPLDLCRDAVTVDDEPGTLVVELESDIAARTNAQSSTDAKGNCDLAF
jgi:hypothetical protein